MESPNSSKEFEITGVSRSGRVRKKSSKLIDFRSPDEIEPKSKKSYKVGKGQSAHKSDYDMAESDDGMDNEEANISNEMSDSGDEFDKDDIEDEGDESDDNSGEHAVHQSLYMSEKSNKKRIFKDGKVIMEKAQRKDKGKSRFTAYMLWARDIRQNVLNKSANADFATTSRKLGEMWANVPASEKTNWRKKAKKLAKKTQHPNNEDNQKQTKSFFINRATTSRTRKIAQQSNQTVNTTVKANSPTQQSPSSIFSSTIKVGNNVVTQPGAFKVTGIEPIDVAAHLKLLGDSLTIIGERLKEHEGQITVSGSLSVLLDSLLCSIGPLICLTTQIPGLENRKSLNDNLHATLDNIAYVMPGL